MAATTNFSLTLLDVGQTQKEATINLDLQSIDNLLFTLGVRGTSSGSDTWSAASLTSPTIAGSAVFTGSALATGTGGIGYGTGAGGTISQGTSKSTGVTLNKVTGQITLFNTALAAGASVSFTLTNSTIAATDLMFFNHVSGGTIGAYGVNAQCAAGSATITITNRSGGSLSEAPVIAFAVFKSVTS